MDSCLWPSLWDSWGQKDQHQKAVMHCSKPTNWTKSFPSHSYISPMFALVLLQSQCEESSKDPWLQPACCSTSARKSSHVWLPEVSLSWMFHGKPSSGASWSVGNHLILVQGLFCLAAVSLEFMLQLRRNVRVFHCSHQAPVGYIMIYHDISIHIPWLRVSMMFYCVYICVAQQWWQITVTISLDHPI